MNLNEVLMNTCKKKILHLRTSEEGIISNRKLAMAIISYLRFRRTRLSGCCIFFFLSRREHIYRSILSCHSAADLHARAQITGNSLTSSGQSSSTRISPGVFTLLGCFNKKNVEAEETQRKKERKKTGICIYFLSGVSVLSHLSCSLARDVQGTSPCIPLRGHEDNREQMGKKSL